MKKFLIVSAVIALLGVVLGVVIGRLRLRQGGDNPSPNADTTTHTIAANPATESAASAINSFGVDLLTRATKTNENCVVSPYSIQSALAMAYAGAEGRTRAEMAKALHYVSDEAALHRSFAALQKTLDQLAADSAKQAEQWKRQESSSAAVPKTADEPAKERPKHSESEVSTNSLLGPSQVGRKTSDPVTLTVANRLFGQEGYNFLAPFLALAKDNYAAPFQALDFAQDATSAGRQINQWVEDRTRQRIRSLIPDGMLPPLTRLVLVNAIYLKAPWDTPFEVANTKARRFYVVAGKAVDVPTMTQKHQLGYARRNDFSVVALPYGHQDLKFLVLLPDSVNGLAGLERGLTSGLLRECAQLEAREVVLYLPKLKLDPPLLPLGSALRGLGMKSAFDDPRGSANFNRLAPRRPDDYLYLSEVLHKTFLSLDEEGTEAAAATSVLLESFGIESEKPQPIEVRVDHPFLFAIQHRPSGACLFLGRVTDPR